MSAAEVQAVSLAFNKALIDRAMAAEMIPPLAYRPGVTPPAPQASHRNEHSEKTLMTDEGPVRIAVPRDRQCALMQLLIPKHARRFTGFDDKIIAMSARGMTVREVQGVLAEQYGTVVSPDFISSVTWFTVPPAEKHVTPSQHRVDGRADSVRDCT